MEDTYIYYFISILIYFFMNMWLTQKSRCHAWGYYEIYDNSWIIFQVWFIDKSIQIKKCYLQHLKYSRIWCCLLAKYISLNCAYLRRVGAQWALRRESFPADVAMEGSVFHALELRVVVPQVLLQVRELDEGPATLWEVAFVGPLAWKKQQREWAFQIQLIWIL